tara:strand:+ start:204 stop:467 length:264 start_codon:yes stop_codon:yes gene_type:complete
MVEKSKSNCSTCSNCYVTIALCVSFLAIGMIIGNCIGKCQSNQNIVTSQTNVLNTVQMTSQAVRVTGLENLKNVNQIAQKHVVLKIN